MQIGGHIMPLTQQLDMLVTTLHSKGRNMNPHLRTGLTANQFQNSLFPIGIEPTIDLYELYTWHDGVDDEDAPELLFGEHQFLPINGAVREYQAFLQEYPQTSSSINLVRCFPFASFQGSILAEYCGTDKIDGLQNPVIEIYQGISIAFESIERMAQTINEWFLAGVYDSQPADEQLRRNIQRRLNSLITYQTTSL
jgi:hypothetical protein